MRWILVFCFILCIGCASEGPEAINHMKVERIDTNHFKLSWGKDKALLEINKNFDLEVLYNTQAIPKKIFAILQSLAWLTNPKYLGYFKMKEHYLKTKELSGELSLYQLTYYTIIYSFKLKSLSNLKSIDSFILNNIRAFSTAQYTRLSSLMYFYMAILETNWTNQKNYLIKATSLESQDQTLKNYAQIFSLSVLKMSIKYYKDQLEKHKYYKKLGLDEALSDNKFSLGEALGQTLGNTFNVIRYNIPKYKEIHEQKVAKLILKMNHYIKAIDVITNKLKQGKSLYTINTKKILNQHPLAEDFLKSQAYVETKIRGVFSNYIINSRRVSLPTLQSLRLYNLKEYLYPYWNDRILSEGVNMWSIFLLMKGPQIVELVFGLHGTHTAVKIMSLRAIWTQPLEWATTTAKAFGFWIKAETLDGCLPTWAFIIGSAFKPDANNNIDYGIPFISELKSNAVTPTKYTPGTYGL